MTGSQMHPFSQHTSPRVNILHNLSALQTLECGIFIKNKYHNSKILYDPKKCETSGRRNKSGGRKKSPIGT